MRMASSASRPYTLRTVAMTSATFRHVSTDATMTATARMKIDWDLTLLHGVEFQEQLYLTYEGQAHFASTGPAGARCRGCTYWGDGQGEPSIVLAGNSAP